MDGAALVRAEIADLSRGDLDAVMSYYTDDVYFEDVSIPKPYVGKEAMREFMAEFYSGFPDLRIEIEHVVETGSVVAAEYHLLGTHDGPFVGNEPTGRAFRVPAVSVYEHNGELFTRETVYYDSASLFRQLGIAPQDQ